MSLTDREILARAAQIKKRDKAKRTKHKRQPRPKAPTLGKNPRLIDKDYKGWISQLPCIATLKRTKRVVYGVQVAHVRSSYPETNWRAMTGMQRKPSDDRCVPLSPEEHRLQHSMKETAYWEELDIYPPHLTADLRNAYPDVEAGIKILMEYAKA